MSSINSSQESAEERAPALDVVDRVSETCFGLFMALTFVGAVSSATAGPDAGRTMLSTAIGCNLAWGLVDAIMYLVRTLAGRGMLQKIVVITRHNDPASGIAAIREALPPAMNAHVSDEDLEPLRRRFLSGAAVPARPKLRGGDLLAALRIFCIVVLSTFPVALPFVLWHDVRTALVVSRALTLIMLFACGAALGHYGGVSPWRAGFGMMALGVALTAAVIALGG
nr:VIT1/CCC1 transporter family protein [uncultured Cupriavidus sp.]